MSEVLAVIPARGGSKGVPRKNVSVVGGIPLVVRAIRACQNAQLVTKVAVSTDDDEIAAVAQHAGALIVRRPSELATDTASSESALLHAMKSLYGEDVADLAIVTMVQCTSPFIISDDVDDTIAAVLRDGADTAFSAARFHGFLWRPGESAFGVNHDHTKKRQRRQDFEADLLETGAVYAMKAKEFAKVGNRFFGNIRAVPTDANRVLEIDSPNDLARARAFVSLMDPPADKPSKDDIDAIVLDFDGTQTDDRVWIGIDGDERVAAHRGDGLGIAALRDAGIPVLFLSTEVNPLVKSRANKLKVECINGVSDKSEILKSWCRDHRIPLSRVLYVGNEVNDLGCLEIVGWPVAVCSAHPVVKDQVKFVTSAAGGHGAIREIASWLLGGKLGK